MERNAIKNDFSIFFLLGVFIGIPIIGNILTSIWAMKLSPLVFTKEVNFDYINIIKQYYFGNIISILLIFSIFTVFYFYPITKKLSTCIHPSDLDLNQKKKIINAPIIVALLVIPAWLLAGFLGDYIVFSLENLRPEIKLKSYLLGSFFSLLGGCFGFVIFYYSLEYFNRKFFIPVLFINKKVSEIRSFWQLSIPQKFIIYFFALSMIPSFLLLAVAIRLSEYNTNLEIHAIIETIAWIIPFFLGISALITFFVSKLYQTPILQMKEAAEKISKEDYSINIEINSTDELGLLQETMITMAHDLKDKDFIKDTFGKIVEPEIRDHLLKGNINLGGELAFVTILFCDIRGFTSLSENLPPDKVLSLLNRYFQKMSLCIREENGLVNKFIGDAVLAIFGAPIPHERHALNSIHAGLKMKTALKELNEELKKENIPEIRFGIGIHTGEVLSGNLGSNTRMEYTVIGDTVNIASRLEGLCKEYKTDMIISEQTLKESQYEDSQYLNQVTVKGKTKPIKVYSIG